MLRGLKVQLLSLLEMERSKLFQDIESSSAPVRGIPIYLYGR
jgi:hypothetical protein